MASMRERRQGHAKGLSGPARRPRARAGGPDRAAGAQRRRGRRQPGSGGKVHGPVGPGGGIRARSGRARAVRGKRRHGAPAQPLGAGAGQSAGADGQALRRAGERPPQGPAARGCGALSAGRALSPALTADPLPTRSRPRWRPISRTWSRGARPSAATRSDWPPMCAAVLRGKRSTCTGSSCAAT